MFAWKEAQWIDFLKALGSYQVCIDLQDQLLWKFLVSGSYSPNSFIRVVNNSSREGWKELWLGLFPHKVEVFCWQALLRKITVRTNLADRNLLNGRVLDCPMCGRVEESVFHLLFSCDFA